MNKTDLSIRRDSGNSGTASSPTEDTLSPTKTTLDYSRRQETKKNVSVAVPGVMKPKAPIKKKKVAPTIVSEYKILSTGYLRKLLSQNSKSSIKYHVDFIQDVKDEISKCREKGSTRLDLSKAGVKNSCL